MDSGLGSDDDHHHSQQFLLGPTASSFVLGEMTEPPKTKDQKQLRNRLLSMEAADEERRRGAMLFSAQKTSQEDPDKKPTVNGEPEVLSLPQNGGSERDVSVWGSESAMSTSRDSENLMSSSETLVLSETCGETPYNSMLEVSGLSAEGARESRSLRRKPMGFFVDLSQIISDGAEMAKAEPSSSSTVPSNKNIFSMVIDFEAPKKDKPVKLTSSMCRKPVKQPVIEPTPKKKPTTRPLNLNDSNHKCQSRNHQTRSSSDVITGDKHKDRSVAGTSMDRGDGLSIKPFEQIDDHKAQGSGDHKMVQSFVKLSDMKSLAQPSNDHEVKHSTVMSRSVPEVTSWLESPLSTMVLGYRSTIQPSRDDVNMSERRTCDDRPTGEDLSVSITQNGSFDTNMNHLDTDDPPRQPFAKGGPLSLFNRSISEERPYDDGQSDGWEWSRPCDLDHLNQLRGEIRIESADGRILRGHRNVLVSRCRYFAGALVTEPSRNGRRGHHVLTMKDFSYESLRFALRHAYSGVLSHSQQPDGVPQLQELAHLADVLGIEGLRDYVEEELVKHMFAGCQRFRKTPSANLETADDASLRESFQDFTVEYNTTVGFRSHSCASCLSRCLLFVLPLANSRNFEELQRSCVSFLARNFRDAWLLREFHSLAADLRERCLRETTASVGVESCLRTRLECQKLRADVARLEMATGWAEEEVSSALRLVDRLEEELRAYLGRSFAAVLGSRHVTGLDDLDEEGVEELLEVVGGWLLEAAGELGVEQACKAYSRCWKMLETQLWAKRSFMEMLVKIRIRLEQVLVDQADRLIRSNAWLRLDTKLRKRIKDLAPKNLDLPYPRSRLPVPPHKKPLPPSNKTVHPTSTTTTNRTRPTDLGGVVFQEMGGVSLRRSLLLAAKAPQAHQAAAPPTNQRRVSSLTRPTAASAAKSVKKGAVATKEGRRSDSPSASDHSVVSPKFGDRRAKGVNFKESPKKETLSPKVGDRRTLTNPKGANFRESPKKEAASPHRGLSPKFGDRRTTAGAYLRDSPKKDVKSPLSPKFGDRRTNSKGAYLRDSPKKDVKSPLSPKFGDRRPKAVNNVRQSPKEALPSQASPRLSDRRGLPKGVNLKEIVKSSPKQGVSQKAPQRSSPRVDHGDTSKGSTSKSPAVDDSPVDPNRDGSPRMRRSSTFLKDEPTVLGKLIN